MQKSSFFVLVLCCIFITSCAVQHNIPNNQTPNESLNTVSYKVFVDQNGDFFPDEWETTYGKHNKRGAYSLNTLAIRNDETKNLYKFRAETLSEIKEKFKSSDRIFILVHGYNNSEDEAKEAYEALKGKISFNSNDGIIEFYWDGLVANGPIRSLKIWFNATGYSQLAGERALRPILNEFINKEIVLLSHSRGASVLLSALSDPPYNEKFAEETYTFHQIKVQNQPKLSDNNNEIKVIMLAPAVGQVDFRTPEYYITDRSSFRSFSDQLKRLHITINKNDKVLKKYVRVLSSKLNPTDLGYNIGVFNLLRQEYSYMSMTDFSGLKSHAFIDYVNDERFKVVLNDLDIKTN